MPGFKDVHSSHIPGRAICTKIGQCHVWSAGRGGRVSPADPSNDGRHSANDDPLPGAAQPVRDCMRAEPWEHHEPGLELLVPLGRSTEDLTGPEAELGSGPENVFPHLVTGQGRLGRLETRVKSRWSFDVVVGALRP